MESQASRILDTPVHIQSISVDLPNYAFVIHGVRVEPRGEGEPPLEVASVRGELNPTRIFDRLLHLRLLEVRGLVIRVQDYGGGRIELPGRWVGSGVADGGAARFGVLADRIRLEDAVFVYNNVNIPWRLEAEELAANLERQGADRFQGEIHYQRGSVRIKERGPVEAALRARFSLVGRELRVEEVVARGEFYQLSSSGRIGWGERPEAELALSVESEVGPAARHLLGLPLLESEPEEHDQPATFQGTLLMGRGWHLVRGVARVPRARFAGMPLRDFTANVLWDRNVVEVRSGEGWVAGGTARFDFRQAIPLSSAPAEVTLSLEDVQLSQLNEPGNEESERFGSRVSGSLDLAFPLTNPSLASGRFELTGVAQEEPGISGLDFTLGGAMEEGALELGESRFETEGVVATAAGLYPRTGSTTLRFELDARDLARADRLQRTLRSLWHPERPAAELRITGSGRARGFLRERLPRLTFEGTFTGRDVYYRGIEWGAVEAEGSLSSEAVRFDSFRAERGDAQLFGRGTLSLGEEARPGASDEVGNDDGVEGLVRLNRDFDLQWESIRWPASDLELLLHAPIGLSGLLSATGSFSNTQGRLSGTGRASLSAGSLQGQEFDTASTLVTVRGQELILDELSVSRGSAELRGTFRLDLQSQEVKSDLQATRVPVAALGLSSWDVQGELEGSIAIAGKLEEPNVDMEGEVTGLRLAQTPLGHGRVEAHLSSGTARGAISIAGSDLELAVEARGRLTPVVALAGTARWRGGDLAPLIRSALPSTGLPESLRLISTGEASFDGRLDSIANMSADGRLSGLSVEVSDYRLAASAPVELRLRQGTLQTGELELVGDDTRIRAQGGVGLVDGELDLNVGGAVNLQILDSVFPSMSWSGGAELSAHLGGGWSHPSLTGYVDLDQGALSFRAFPHAIGDIRGRALFDNRTIRLHRIDASFGAAPVILTGTLTLNRLRPDAFDLSASGKGLRLRYPEGLVAEVDTELRLTGTPARQVLSGQLDVRQATWTREYDIAAGILGTKDVIDFLEGPEEQTFPDLRLDVRVNAPDSLRVRNSLAIIDARAELQLRGTLARPSLLGRAEALQGEVFLLGQRYNVLSGKVEFVDPNSIRPFFDLTAETRVRSYRVELRLAGTPDRFFPELSSDPPLRTVDILRLLAGATERELHLGSEEEEVASVGVASLLTERLNQELSRRAERLFGLDRISIDPFLVGQFSNPTARVSIGKQISRDLAINYSTAFGETTESIVVVIEYTPEGPVTWTISRDETGALAVDMKFRKSF